MKILLINLLGKLILLHRIRKFTLFFSAQTVTLSTFDLLPKNTENECRLSAAGLAFVLHGRKAITKIIAKGDRDNLRKFLKNNKKEAIPNLYRRTYRRLVRLIDQLALGKEIIPR